ncbi:TetR/AcrR family transcriptional regulator [Nocardioides sambongensis]|uniref:TetR/AcrR family transcriptional regulator n=1 Tax=Nocardioides sambongensis TaxID=2589074 RepID=UPI00112D0514|nr:TetR/AcrR family transcriptional regulator [Nocardioides sambongensis]
MPHVPASERRVQLVEAATRLISRDGVGAATTRRIAEEAAAPAASVYYTFGTKEQLFIQVLSSSVGTTGEVLNDVDVPDGAGLVSAVSTLLKGFTRLDPDSIMAQFDLLLWSLRQDVVQDAAADTYRDLWNGMTASYQRAAAPDEKSADFHLLARLTTTTCDGILFGMLCNRGSYLDDVHLDTIAMSMVRMALQATV